MPTWSSSPPTTARSSGPRRWPAIAERAKPDCLVVDPWNALGAAQVFAYANEIAALRT